MVYHISWSYFEPMAQSQTALNTIIVWKPLSYNKKSTGLNETQVSLKDLKVEDEGRNCSLFHWFPLTLIWVIELIFFVVSCLVLPRAGELCCVWEWAVEGRCRGDGFEAFFVCVCMKTRFVGHSVHCRVFEFLVFTSNPLGTSCHSLFLLSVHFSHLSLPPSFPFLCLT